jgi:hypothetical protein
MRVVIHVGLHKTATTFLQSRIFPRLPGTTFVHPHHRPQPDDGPIERFVREVFFRNAACVDVAAHSAAIERWIGALSSEPLLVSTEALVGLPIENHATLLSNATLLAKVFPDAKIVLVIRRQDSWVVSAYAQLLRAGLSTTIERYLNWDRTSETFGSFYPSVYNGPNVDARDLAWERFDALYREVFGSESVLTLPFELFKDDPGAFVGELCAFVGCDAAPSFDPEERVNERWGRLGILVAKAVNRVPMSVKIAIRDRLGKGWHPSEIINRVGGRLGLVRGARGASQELEEPLRGRLMDLHRDGNRRLADRLGRDLGKWGYC